MLFQRHKHNTYVIYNMGVVHLSLHTVIEEKR